jgi:hypothetical protein
MFVSLLLLSLAMPILYGAVGSVVIRWWLPLALVPLLPIAAAFSDPGCRRTDEFLCNLGTTGVVWLCFVGAALFLLGFVAGRLVRDLLRKSIEVFGDSRKKDA